MSQVRKGPQGTFEAALASSVVPPFVSPRPGHPSNIGQSAPLGATVSPAGVNFSLYSRDASGVDLLFFQQEDDTQPSRVGFLGSFLNHTNYSSITIMLAPRA